MKIALDAMGGDSAPAEPVKGALLATKELGVEIALVGPEESIRAELSKHPKNDAISVVDAGEAITMNEDRVVQAVRQRRDASINVASALVRDGEAQAVVSAGNSGAVMASAFLILGRISGVERPGLGMLLPYNAGRVFVIDIGANVDSRPNHLLQFAQMGSAFVKNIAGLSNPRVALLSNGEEASKGNELVQEAHEKLRESSLNFIGNIEGVSVHKAVADVVVTDGFTGNIALKVGEGTADYILEQVRSVIKSSPLYVAAAILLKPALRRALKRMQYEEYGGANLLGVNGVVVIAHGRSDSVAIKNALRVAKAAGESNLIETIRASMGTPSTVSPPNPSLAD